MATERNAARRRRARRNLRRAIRELREARRFLRTRTGVEAAEAEMGDALVFIGRALRNLHRTAPR
ncbi:hypothetical protein [Effusibacillus dendaii]|uniref:Uncharacterized protein n=1 Tax=Effusibacillus dendaii TaxID=2743772 RepID=A0A7I8DDA6_9BACL|nr:hypothetical protein [Effusibacillus dendaii]BCJ88203.1 hypothetical protein skT53_31880 [Effusibacillus dendaii]